MRVKSKHFFLFFGTKDLLIYSFFKLCVKYMENTWLFGLDLKPWYQLPVFTFLDWTSHQNVNSECYFCLQSCKGWISKYCTSYVILKHLLCLSCKLILTPFNQSVVTVKSSWWWLPLWRRLQRSASNLQSAVGFPWVLPGFLPS